MKRLFASLLLLSLLILSMVVFAAAPQKDERALDFTQSQHRISRAQLKVYSYVVAGYGEDFIFDGLKVNVKEYTVVYMPAGGDSFVETIKGDKLSSALKQKFAAARTGDKIILSQVKVSGDFGERYINGPLLTVY